jgi:hypothetical protein
MGNDIGLREQEVEPARLKGCAGYQKTGFYAENGSSHRRFMTVEAVVTASGRPSIAGHHFSVQQVPSILDNALFSADVIVKAQALFTLTHILA